jgi:excisionase family DNA binding protein
MLTRRRHSGRSGHWNARSADARFYAWWHALAPHVIIVAAHSRSIDRLKVSPANARVPKCGVVVRAPRETPMATRPLLLTVPEAAAELRCSRRTVYSLLSSGKLSSLKMGGLRRIAAVELDRFVASLSEESDRAAAM